ncbi:TadE family protein [Azospirillum sp.]|uniref:TadE/TadG family type IV pilus assembly protein n=1 Tax=Azospirillum sp. TaxID=34012 RepID=UPI002D3145FA|nr:TadE family protein [Azospirillum sp.]HYD66416.1 TadE family protein [Azospirillum sp.]
MTRRPRLLSCERGASIVEFALAAPVMLLAMLAVIEGTLTLFVSAALEGGVRSASRYGMTGHVPAGTSRTAEIVESIRRRTLGLANGTNTTVSMRVYKDFAALKAGGAGSAGPGNAGEVVVYTASFTAPVWTPVAAFMHGGGPLRLSATTVVRNEPYDDGVQQ